MNVVILIGTLSRAPEVRELPSGASVAALELTTRDDGHTAVSVPIAVHEPASSLIALDVGTELVVTGQVRRRFFRAGGVTQSRTEVVATKVVPAHHRRRAGATVERVLTSIAEGYEVAT